MSVAAQRLSALDLYHQLDWLEQGWDEDELLVTPRLQRLKRHLDSISGPHREKALELYARLVDARLIANRPWRATLVELRATVAAWERSRPPLRVCGHEYVSGRRCSVGYRDPELLAEHRRLVHGENP